MRDLILTAFIFGCLPFIVRKPFLGVLLWTLLGLMNPHRLCWGFAVNLPFAQIVALVLLGSILVSNEVKRLPNHILVIVLASFVLWMFITTLMAFSPGGAWTQWNKVWKIMLMIFVTIMMLTNKIRIISLVVVICISLGFYGIKGGVFTIITGGAHHVFGPAGSFIGENNTLALALIMTVPFFRFFQLQATGKLLKSLLFLAMLLMIVSIFGSQSRGAFLGLGGMILFLVLKGRNKGPLLVGMLLFIPMVILFMPESYLERMHTITEYQEDSSAMSRIHVWITSWRIVMDYPIFGGGFKVLFSWAWPIYAPVGAVRFDAHSIYFQILGEHGFVGFILFLWLGIGSFFLAGKIARHAGKDEKIAWMRNLATMLQVSIVGYAVSGTFLGLAYFDLLYVLFALVIALDVLLKKYEAEGIPEYEGGDLFAPNETIAVDKKGIANRMPRLRIRKMKEAAPQNIFTKIKVWYSSL